MHYSILDLAPVPEGSDTKAAIENSVRLAKIADELNYHRFWLAEHHNMPGIASAATSVLIGHIADQTTRIRVGSGGVMLPNHSPLSIAEQFGTLATIHGPRIDLGVGRAPGGDGAVYHALRKSYEHAENFPQDVIELLGYLGPKQELAPVQAHPGQDTNVPVWILGSSLFGAQLAAMAGLPYAFASHFAPAQLEEAMTLYRETFAPSQWGPEKSQFMLAVNVIAADTDEQAAFLQTSQQLAFARLRMGKPGLLPRPDAQGHIPANIRRLVDMALKISAVGAPKTIKEQMRALIATYQPDEIILTGQIHDPEAREGSFALAAEVMEDLQHGR